jgi:hypothetical protein
MLGSYYPSSSFLKQGEGFDPIIGENQGLPKNTSFLNPDNTAAILTIPQGQFTSPSFCRLPFFLTISNTDFVVSRGGEYFFAPSLSAILNTIAA